jgi:dihydrofolate reductase
MGTPDRRQPGHRAHERDHQIRRLEDPEGCDAWQNSVLLRGDPAGTVAELKAQPGGDVGIIGSVSLVRSLHAAGLTDRYTLLICPLTLGSGARLFEGPPR